MRKQSIIILLTVLSLFILYRCERMIMEQGTPPVLFTEADRALLSSLHQHSIFFGHQSVGSTILAGIRDLEKEAGKSRFHMIETDDVAGLPGSFFAHCRVGTNTDPLSKMRDFKNIMDNGMGGKARIAFFKFCYVDISLHTDVVKLFESYKSIMGDLKEKYPDVLFVHWTVPLTTPMAKPVALLKRFIKKILGKHSWDYDDNITRNQYNALVRQEYEGKEPVFDLARFESTSPDGTRTKHKKGTIEFYTLVPEYTNDGGHLNERGRTIIAGRLILFLSQL
jgi:hypothetical protein